MLQHFFKSTLKWQGILPNGHYKCGEFNGSKLQFYNYLSKNNITLIRLQRNFQLAKSINKKQLITQFTQELSSILSTGITLIVGLNLLKQRHLSSSLEKIIVTIISLMQSGHTFSQALQKHLDWFPAYYIALIKTAESCNGLPDILNHIAKQMQFSQDAKAKILKALIYPASVLAFTLFITLGLLIFAIPQFQAIFSNFNATLPLVTQVIIYLSQFLLQHCLLIMICVILTIIIPVILYLKNKFFRHLLQWIVYHSPWIGKLYHQKQQAQWCYMMQIGLITQQPIAQCLQFANDTLTYFQLQKNCNHQYQHLGSGLSLHELLSATQLFNTADLYQIKLGIDSQTLANTLAGLSQQSYAAINHRLENLSKWLEPVIMLLLALIAGGLIISMYLPIFKIGTIL